MSKKRIKPKKGTKKNPWKINPRQTKVVKTHLVRTKKGDVYIRGGYEHDYPKGMKKKEEVGKKKKKEEGKTKPKTDKELMIQAAKEEVACRLGVGI